jgi:hypothetical protein
LLNLILNALSGQLVQLLNHPSTHYAPSHLPASLSTVVGCPFSNA